MAQAYRQITPDLARQIRLVMADVDGTLTTSGDYIYPTVPEAVRGFGKQGIIMGLVSGRTLRRLESLAHNLGISGPIIAENGGVAKLSADSELIDLGYSRRSAIKALETLKAEFPNRIRTREDNRDRLVDVVFWSQGVQSEELMNHLEDVQLLDSGYILHLMQKGVSKGRTLMRLLEDIGDGTLSPAEVLVVGDSTTDLSLFELFPHSVLTPNPGLPIEETEMLKNVAGYVSDLPSGEGFAEVAFHILKARVSGAQS
jgi:phosphoglycolate phosphatase (TIGR01487 family)